MTFKLTFTVILGDFNATSKLQWADGIKLPDNVDIDSLTTMPGLHQLISDPTYLLPTSLSCIDLIFTDQPNLAFDCGVYPSVYPIIIIKSSIVNSIL